MSIGLETLTTNKQSDALGTGIASEQSHWYDRKTGAAVYEVPMTTKAGMRKTTIKDARKLDLVPSVTSILKEIAKPGLEIWKAKQLLEAALTLPRKQGENLDAYAERVVEDSKAQGVAAANRGKRLHKAIEDYIRGIIAPEWKEHLEKLESTLTQHGINLRNGQPEHSFSASINGCYYGGKTDYSHDTFALSVIDFKTKDVIEPKKQLAYDEHSMQIAAYGYGLFGIVTSNGSWKWNPFRGLNVFVGVNDCEIRVHEHKPEDLETGFELFQCLLSYWTRKHKFGKFAKP